MSIAVEHNIGESKSTQARAQIQVNPGTEHPDKLRLELGDAYTFHMQQRTAEGVAAETNPLSATSLPPRPTMWRDSEGTVVAGTAARGVSLSENAAVMAERAGADVTARYGQGGIGQMDLGALQAKARAEAAQRATSSSAPGEEELVSAPKRVREAQESKTQKEPQRLAEKQEKEATLQEKIALGLQKVIDGYWEFAQTPAAQAIRQELGLPLGPGATAQAQVQNNARQSLDRVFAAIQAATADDSPHPETVTRPLSRQELIQRGVQEIARRKAEYTEPLLAGRTKEEQALQHIRELKEQYVPTLAA